MNVQVITQPFDSQGNPQTLGGKLQHLLSQVETTYTEIWIISAWASNRTFQRLARDIERHKNAGAVVHAYIGIDLQGTSIEAVRTINRYGIDSKIVFNRRPTNTFHPKIYLFEAQGSKADIFVGSNNLTDGGMYTNYEASTWISLSLPQEAEIYNSIKESLRQFLYPPGEVSADIDNELIEALARANLIVPEQIARRNRARRSSSNRDPGNPVEVPFAAIGILPAPPFDLPDFVNEPIVNIPNERKELVWRKNDLPLSDAQRPRLGNPTGGLRLTQAGWRVNGQLIDQTDFFRNTLFVQSAWSRGVNVPLHRETTRVAMEVHLLGNDYGLHEIVISHKPEGEAGQGNYTTMLHWGDLADLIRNLNLVGRTFRLFRLDENNEANFRIVVS